MLGTATAKLAGVRHIYYYATGTYTRDQDREPLSELSGASAATVNRGSSLKSEGHPGEVQPQLVAGTVSCLDCHARRAHAEGRQVKRLLEVAIVLAAAGTVLCLWLLAGVTWVNFFFLHGSRPAAASWPPSSLFAIAMVQDIRAEQGHVRQADG